jgi:hypothetical protein
VILSGAFDQDLTDQNGSGGGEAHLGFQLAGEVTGDEAAARGVNEGEAPVVQGDEEVEYGDRDVAARSMARRATKRCPGLAGNRRWSSVEARACSVCVGFDYLKHGSAEKLVREMRMIKTEGMVQEGEVGGVLLHRNGRSSPAAVACSGEKLFGPGSVIGRGKKGEEERRGRPSYRRGRGDETAGINRD